MQRTRLCLTAFILLSLMPPAALAQQGGPVAALQAQVDALAAQVTSLASGLAAAQDRIATLEATDGELESALAAAQERIAALEAGSGSSGFDARLSAIEANTVLALDGHLFLEEVETVLPGFAAPVLLPRAVFEDINVQITNGEGQDTPNGTGNLIVGFDAPGSDGQLPNFVCSDGAFAGEASCTQAGEIWARSHKSGSHNLIVGPGHAYSQTGGVIFGVLNSVNRDGATVTGGRFNTASGLFSSVSGGQQNTAVGGLSSVSGGQQNTAGGGLSSISGGLENTAGGDLSSVSGGGFNIASRPFSSVSGGQQNTAGGEWSSVSGGQQNTAVGGFSSVSGGASRSAPGQHNWAAGALLQPN